MINLLKLHLKRLNAKFRGESQRVRELKLDIINERRKRYRLGVSYNVFDGVELLESSIKSIRKNVDYINVVFQDVSNFGEAASSKSLDEIKRLVDAGLIDNVIYYKTNLKQKPHWNETLKRDIGLRDCLHKHCTHFLCMDTDEYYRENEFLDAKNYIYDHGITVSVCQTYVYVKKPTYRFEYPCPTMFVPFISKVNRFTHIKFLAKRFCLTDPTRMIATNSRKIWVFEPIKICMHHMSLVRKDLSLKFRNSTLNEDERYKRYYSEIANYEYPNKLNYYGIQIPIIEVEDEFSVGDLVN